MVRVVGVSETLLATSPRKLAVVEVEINAEFSKNVRKSIKTNTMSKIPKNSKSVNIADK